MGLTAGLVGPRVNAGVKAGLLELVEHAITTGGWSLRRAAATLGLEHVRLLRWQARAALDRLDDAKPDPGEAAHALLAWERDAILALAEDRGGIDRSHRKLTHRGSRLDRGLRVGVDRAARARRGRDAAARRSRAGQAPGSGRGRTGPNSCLA